MNFKDRYFIALLLMLLLAPAVGGSTEQYTNIAYKKLQFEAVQISVPDWAVVEKLDQGATGKIKLSDPGGNGRYLKLSWYPGKSDGLPSPAAVLEKYGLHQISDVEINIRGKRHLIRRYENANGTKRIAEASYDCESSDTYVNIWTFLNAEWNASVEVVQHVVASIQCPEKAIRTTKPIFTPKHGFKLTEEKRNIVIYANASGDAIAFTSASTPTKKLTADDMKLLFNFQFGNSGLRNVQFSDHPRVIDNKEIFSGSGSTDKGEKVFILGTIWTCSKKTQSFWGGYAGAANPVSFEGEELLASAKCP